MEYEELREEATRLLKESAAVRRLMTEAEAEDYLATIMVLFATDTFLREFPR